MTDIIEIELDKEAFDLIDELDDVSDSLEEALRKVMFLAEQKAKLSFGKEGHLRVRTGRLRSSIGYKVKGGVGTIFTNLKYAAIHEYGGNIIPKRAKALKFKVGGVWVITKKVVIPARPYLTPSVVSASEKFNKFFEDDMQKKVD